jgi:hypothetical protein
VSITVDGEVYTVDTTTAVSLDLSTGDWSLTLDGLADGLHEVSLTATDLAGNTSSALSLNAFNVDTVPQYYSGNPSGANPSLGNAWGSQINMLKNSSYELTLLDGLQGTVDPTLTDNVPDGLTLGSDGRLTGTPTTAGTTWLAIHSFDIAGNESTTDVQLVVTTASSTKTTVSNSASTAAKTYEPTGSSIKLTSSNGDVVLAGDGDDTINIANAVSSGSTKQLFARIDGGSGTDVLNFQSTGETIDFSRFYNFSGARAAISHVEQLKFAGADQAFTNITLSAADVFKLHSDATDADGNALLVLTAASSKSAGYLTLNLSGFTQVGDDYAYTSAGAKATATGLTSNYSEFQGTYTDYQGTHQLTVLVQGYFTLG